MPSRALCPVALCSVSYKCTSLHFTLKWNISYGCKTNLQGDKEATNARVVYPPMCHDGSINAALPNSDKASARSASVVTLALLLLVLLATLLLVAEQSWRPRQRKLTRRAIAGRPRSQFCALHSAEPRIVCASVALGPLAPSTRLGNDCTQLLYSPKLEKSR